MTTPLHSSPRRNAQRVPKVRAVRSWRHCLPQVRRLEERRLLSGGLGPAAVFDLAKVGPIPPLTLGGTTLGNLTAGGSLFYQIAPNADGRLLAQLGAAGGPVRLSLLDPQGGVLLQSDGQSAGNPNPLIDEHVVAGTDILALQSLGGGASFTLTTSLTPSSGPFQPVTTGLADGAAPIALGDLNHDGIPDLVAPDGVHLGLGDGTFQPPPLNGALASANDRASALVIGDFNGDHQLDVAVADAGTDQVSVFLNQGDGTFLAPLTISLPRGSAPSALIAGAFTNDGHLDLAVADSGTNSVTVLLGQGDGTFTSMPPIAVGKSPRALAVGDFYGQGHLDLAVADQGSDDLRTFPGQGDGTFGGPNLISLPKGSAPSALVAGDFNRDGRPDLAVTSSGTNTVTVFLNSGRAILAPLPPIAVGVNPAAVVAADLNGDGNLDLAVADVNSNDVTVLLGNGDGSFQAPLHAAAGSAPESLAVGDLNGSGRLDLVTGNGGLTSFDAMNMTVLIGRGDGTFQDQTSAAVGSGPVAIATGDFNNDGHLDLITVDQAANDVSLLLGKGDGTFRIALPLTVGNSPSALAVGDFNGDGRLDVAVAGSRSNDVTILLGNGDGTFHALAPVPVGKFPSALAVGDFLGNGRLDLAVADRTSNDVMILRNGGDGTFLPVLSLSLPKSSAPRGLVAGDFNGDGRADLAAVDAGTGALSVILNQGQGAFQVEPPIPLGKGPMPLSLVAGDFRKIGRVDLAVATGGFAANSNKVEILLGNGDGTFQPPVLASLGSGVDPVAIVAGDFGGTGRLDLATANFNLLKTNDFSVLPGNGDGTFGPPVPYALGAAGSVTAVAAGDFNGDGRADLAFGEKSPNDVLVQLGLGGGGFAGPGVIALAPHNTPLVADLNGDGVPDVTVVDAAGEILYRAGRAREPGYFEPPVKINLGFPSRDIAFVSTGLGPLLASVDANDQQVSLFQDNSGTFVRVASLSTGRLPAQIVSADLNGDGQPDLVVRNAGDGTLSVFLSAGNGWFQPPQVVPVGPGITDVTLADLDQNGIPDLVVTNGLLGTVSVLLNQGQGQFAAPTLYQAGAGLYGTGGTAGLTATRSLEATSGATVGTFTLGGPPSLVTADPGSNTLGIGAGLGTGRFANPSRFLTNRPAGALRAADFNGDGLSDLAYIDADGLHIALADGHGGFTRLATIDAGADPAGLTVGDVNGDGKPDLLIGNLHGDILVLLGNGDGTFLPPRRTDQQTGLAVADLTGTGSNDFIYSDQARDRVAVHYGGTQTAVLGDQLSGLLNPGAVQLAALNGDGVLDLIVVNSGSNNVIVYPGLGDGRFGPALNGGHGYFTGTYPVGITVADVNGDGRPDLIIANKGSNDVSILLNQKNGVGFGFVPGPRLQAGVGPVATAIAQMTPGSPPELLITDSGSNDVRILRGLGGGFFNDQDPGIYPVGINPGALFVGPFTAPGSLDVVTLNRGSNSVTLLSNLGGGNFESQSFSSGGQAPAAALVGDFTGNGVFDLVIANNGDGHLALLAGGAQGFSLVATETEPGLPNPSALALATFSGGQLEFFAANEGVESAALVAFSVGGVSSGLPALLSSTGLSEATAQLIPLNENSLALVGTLLNLTLDQNSGETEGVVAVVATQGLPSQSRDQESSGGDGEENGESASTEPPPVPVSWTRFVLGIDEALDQIRHDAETNPHLFDDPTLNAPAESKAPQPAGSAARPEPDARAFDEVIESEWSAPPRLTVDAAVPAAEIQAGPVASASQVGGAATIGAAATPAEAVGGVLLPALWWAAFFGVGVNQALADAEGRPARGARAARKGLCNRGARTF